MSEKYFKDEDLEMSKLIGKLQFRLGEEKPHSLVGFLNHWKTTLDELKSLERILSQKNPERNNRFFTRIGEPTTIPWEDLIYVYHGRIRSMYVTALLRQIHKIHRKGGYQSDEALFKKHTSTLVGMCHNDEYGKEKMAAFIKEILSTSKDLSHFRETFSSTVFARIEGVKPSHSGYVAFARRELSLRMHADVQQADRSPHQMALYSLGVLNQMKARIDKEGERTENEFIGELVSLYSLLRTYKENNIFFPFHLTNNAITNCIRGNPDAQKSVHWLTLVYSLQGNMQRPAEEKRENVELFKNKLEKLFSIKCKLDWTKLEALTTRTNKTLFYTICREAIEITM